MSTSRSTSCSPERLYQFQQTSIFQTPLYHALVYPSYNAPRYDLRIGDWWVAYPHHVSPRDQGFDLLMQTLQKARVDLGEAEML